MMRNQSLSFGDQLMVGEAEKMGGELEEKGGLKKKENKGLVPLNKHWTSNSGLDADPVLCTCSGSIWPQQMENVFYCAVSYNMR